MAPARAGLVGRHPVVLELTGKTAAVAATLQADSVAVEVVALVAIRGQVVREAPMARAALAQAALAAAEVDQHQLAVVEAVAVLAL